METCKICGVDLGPIESMPKHRRLKAAHGLPMVCSEECRSQNSSRTMANTNIRYASERMRKNNPMSDPKCRRAMAKTLKEIGHKPCVRKGNGTGPTLTEQILADTLGAEINVIVPTNTHRGTGLPTHYKIDVGIPEHKIGFEIDGASHGLLIRKKQDRKKTKFLRSLGWIIHRLTNQQVAILCGITKNNVLLQL